MSNILKIVYCWQRLISYRAITKELHPSDYLQLWKYSKLCKILKIKQTPKIYFAQEQYRFVSDINTIVYLSKFKMYYYTLYTTNFAVEYFHSNIDMFYNFAGFVKLKSMHWCIYIPDRRWFTSYKNGEVQNIFVNLYTPFHTSIN